jgi:hypothetical protein
MGGTSQRSDNKVAAGAEGSTEQSSATGRGMHSNGTVDPN